MSDTTRVLMLFILSLYIIANMTEEEKAKHDVIEAVFMMKKRIWKQIKHIKTCETNT